jgi:transcriptional regulator with XRE-family HTH domain
MNQLTRQFGASVRQLRRKRGWSQEHLAALADLNRSYMGEVERGSVVPSLLTAAKLAQALSVSLPELMTFSENAPD